MQSFWGQERSTGHWWVVQGFSEHLKKESDVLPAPLIGSTSLPGASLTVRNFAQSRAEADVLRKKHDPLEGMLVGINRNEPAVFFARPGYLHLLMGLIAYKILLLSGEIVSLDLEPRGWRDAFRPTLPPDPDFAWTR